MRLSLVFLSLLSVSSCSAFMVSGNSARAAQTSLDMERRRILSGALVAASSVVIPGSAFADLSDGNTLPKGAAQFSRVVNIKADLANVYKRVSEHADEIDEKEWDNIGGFLRKLYSAGEDMKGVAKGMTPDKKAKAEEGVKLLQKYAKAGEVPVNKQDAKGFLAVLDKETVLLNDFFDLLSDVPDEI
mmetsp:Transcript_18997/g.22845  ORF Transcript_18997/g.22845 Transcript_18997/m.22845 type:complete len:187 (+) Transcript_18997:106-666(+)|eukprot:CAMPEP_0195257178 /NCGR_PEP_ID=MMETSP0706-20130129/6665_1 /TAXON_ID=33640 /ORGANISM="Asterionellopsis glacialis, Strain CCMP134" /LENGTH=186 /DNA_ID=CAMNT_0040310339 /DNA_START=109 /DNA_END=669 /DNA_ORIENTATION=-